MKNVSRRSLYLVIQILIVISFGGCNTIYTTREMPKSIAEPETVVRQVDFWAVSSDDLNDEFIYQLVNQFNSQHDEIYVNLELKSDKYIYKEYATSMASLTNPDVSVMFHAQAAQFWDRGFLYSMDSVVEDILYNRYKFQPQILEQAMLYKQYFGVPLYIENYILLIREDTLKQKGLKLPENMAELLRVLRAVSTNERAGIALPGKGYLSSRALLYFIMINGGAIFDHDGNIQLAGSKNKEIYQFLNTLYKENLIYQDKMQLGFKELAQLFIKGEAAAILTTPVALKDLYSETDTDFINNIKMLSLRGFDDVFHSSGPVFELVLCISKNSQRKEEARIFVKWLCEQYVKLYASKDCPVPSMITTNDKANQNEALTSQVFNEILPYTRYPSYPNPNSVNYYVIEGTDVMNNLFFELLKDVDVDQLIAEYQYQLDEWSIKFNR